MKTPTMLYLDVDVVNRLQEVATDIGSKVSPLVAFLVSGSLDAIPREKLREWAAGVAEAKRAKPKAKPLTGAQTAALSVLTNEFQEMKVIQGETGLSVRVCWRSLKALEAAGLAEVQDYSKTWVRPDTMLPGKSYWRLRVVASGA